MRLDLDIDRTINCGLGYIVCCVCTITHSLFSLSYTDARIHTRTRTHALINTLNFHTGKILYTYANTLVTVYKICKGVGIKHHRLHTSDNYMKYNTN